MSRKGMTLFELLVVMMIVGIVYSISIFTLNKEKVSASTMNLSNLKSTLLALEHTGEIRLICDTLCQECRVWSGDDTVIANMHLESDGSVQRYGFDRYGELKPMGDMLTHTQGALHQSCFEYTLHPDSTSSFLILRDNNAFYAYTPLQDNKPLIAASAESLALQLFDEEHYPLRDDDYYAAQ